jgi:hypothetical protein
MAVPLKVELTTLIDTMPETLAGAFGRPVY